jgi:parvulin-like peptidyl-prolyl isomerase
LQLQSSTNGNPAGGFGALALEASDDQASRHRGGDLGWLDAGNFEYRWPQAVLTAGYALDVGQISPVIETPQGYYVVMKTDARSGSVTPLAEVAPALRQSLLVTRRQQVQEAFRAETVRAAQAKIDSAVLATVEIAPSTQLARATNLSTESPGLPAGPAPRGH